MKTLSALGVSSAVFGRALGARAEEEGSVTAEMIQQAAWTTGLEFTPDERELMRDGVNESLALSEAMRRVQLDNGVAPALRFAAEPPAIEAAALAHAAASITTARSPAAGTAAAPASTTATSTTAASTTPTSSTATASTAASSTPTSSTATSSTATSTTTTAAGHRPQTDDQLAFLPLTELAALLRSRQISSEELTRLHLERLQRFDPELHCVISLTAERAIEQARRADRELAAGHYRGPLHGVPWGAKDLIAVPGYRTTWGAAPFQEQVRDETATVVARLDAAGAVLTAKLSVGALAWGDVWFGGKTRNPWNLEQGSSGSSAGPAAAVAAGLAGFALGTETWGSIVSPCTRCGATGLRPTFGRVSRHGVMALSWSMDKVGPIARSVEDCALVLATIQGADGRDATAVDRPFRWPPERDPRTMRLGYVPALFDEDRATEVEEAQDPEQAVEVAAQRRRLREWAAFDRRTLEVLRALGYELVPLELPATYPVDALQVILTAEASTAFDALTRSGRDDLMVRQVEQAWPNVFRQGQLVPAVEYIRANRIRSLVMQEMAGVMEQVDVFVAPSFGGNHLLLTNLTGHPALVLPNGFRNDDGTPTSITFTGRLFGETELLAVARAYQEATDFHLRHPPLGG